MSSVNNLEKEVGSLATSIRARLVTPGELMEGRISILEKKVSFLSKAFVLLGIAAVLSLGGLVYLSTVRL